MDEELLKIVYEIIQNTGYISKTLVNSEIAMNDGDVAASQKYTKEAESLLATTINDNFEEYISFATGLESKPSNSQSGLITLRDSIIKGLRENGAAKARELLSLVAPLDIVNNEIIPALDVVGVGFEQGNDAYSL